MLRNLLKASPSRCCIQLQIKTCCTGLCRFCSARTAQARLLDCQLGHCEFVRTNPNVTKLWRAAVGFNLKVFSRFRISAMVALNRLSTSLESTE